VVSALIRNAPPTFISLNFNQLSGTVTDGQLASAYSGVGSCPGGQFANAFTRNAAPSCAAPSIPASVVTYSTPISVTGSSANASATTIVTPPAATGLTLFNDTFSGTSLNGANYTYSFSTDWPVSSGVMTISSFGRGTYITAGTNWANYTITFTAKTPATTGGTAGLAGYGAIVFRANPTAHTAYHLAFYANPAQIKIAKCTDFPNSSQWGDGGPSCNAIASGSYTADTNFHTYTVVVAGTTFTVSQDGVQKLTVTDSSYATGSVGFMAGGYEVNQGLIVQQPFTVTAPGTVLETVFYSIFQQAAGAGCTGNAQVVASLSWTDAAGVVQTIPSATLNLGNTLAVGTFARDTIPVAVQSGAPITIATTWTNGAGCTTQPTYSYQAWSMSP